jgi:hypothetical protein
VNREIGEFYFQQIVFVFKFLNFYAHKMHGRGVQELRASGIVYCLARERRAKICVFFSS